MSTIARWTIAALAAAGMAGLVAGAVVGGSAEAGGDGPHRVTIDSAGMAFSQPAGWHLVAPPATSLSYPGERLLLTTYPAKRGGNCSPDRAERALPADGALVFLMEYRPSVG